jgi:hypothetical protein
LALHRTAVSCFIIPGVQALPAGEVLRIVAQHRATERNKKRP